MRRELAAVSFIAFAPACSLILDFSDNALVRDASIDGPYTQEQCDYKEPNDALPLAAVIPLTETGPGAICAGAVDDHDFFRFTITNTTLTIDVTYEMRATGDLDVKLYDSMGNVLSSSHSITGAERIVCPSTSAPPCPAISAGDYIFEVLPAVPGSVNAYTFAITN